MAAIEVSQLRKSYGSVVALDGLDLLVEEGEVLGLLGPNGAGKSTLVRALMGRVRPNSGRIVLFGRSVDEPGARWVLGYVPQEIALYDGLTARENLECFGRLLGLRGGDLRSEVAAALQFSGLVERQADLVGGFSGGMKRRLNFAVGLLGRPRAVLLDEPTVGVDPQSRERLFEMVEKLRAQGTTVLYTTHYLEEAERLCDRVAIIDGGRVLTVGQVADLVREHLGGKVRLELELAAAPSPESLALLEGHGTRRTAPQRFEVEVNEPAAWLAQVLGELARMGVSVGDVQLHRPGLDEVFLKLTGKELRE
jgi:ABC-2 type transport system ATP-binding protein